jgi:hypothetical protein
MAIASSDRHKSTPNYFIQFSMGNPIIPGFSTENWVIFNLGVLSTALFRLMKPRLLFESRAERGSQTIIWVSLQREAL